ncbi:LysR family transcriptional regulator [Fastidiosibacter lacustris]|uniref:LysR family transcriptional regulator n=1 Tax=Fastidiosibacter lacustris TaxID=2056695 RepID=UPI000E3417C3|nr:LysR family transcriptional regulator [Fastidiosibacter lacustris]
MELSKIHYMPLKMLPVFLCVVKHLSFSKAAQELCVTHSAVSQNIKTLETYLGIKLFNRQNGKEITLTLLGEHYYQQIQSAIELIYQANTDIKNKQQKNQLVLNLPSSFMTKIIVPNLKHFEEKYPLIKLTMSSHKNLTNFYNKNYDCEIVYVTTQQLPQDYVCKKLLDDALILIYPKSTQFQKKHEMIQHYKPIYVNDELRKEDWQRFCHNIQISEPAENERLYVSSTIQAIDIVASGYGCFVTHEALIKQDLKTRNINIAPQKFPCEKSYYFCSSPDKFQLDKVTCFYAWLIYIVNDNENEIY